MAIGIDVSELQGAVDDAVRALRAVANDPNQDGKARVHAALGILEFAAHLEEAHNHDEDEWDEEEENEVDV